MKKLLLHSILSLLMVSFCNAQEKPISIDEMTELMQNVNSIYNQKEYHVAIEISSYKGHYSVIPEDHSKGFIHKKNETVEQYQLGIYSLQNKQIKVMIDSTENMVGITYPDSTFSQTFAIDTGYVNKYKNAITNISKIETNNGVVLLNISYKKGLPFEKIYIRIHQDFIEEITLFYANEIEYEDDNSQLLKDKPKLKINFRKMISNQKTKFNLTDIVYKVDKKYVLTDKFKNFELIDFRYNN